MSSILLGLSLLINSASAKDLPAGSLPLTQAGGVVDLHGCESHVLANPWSATNIKKVVIGQAEAQRICAEAKGDLAIAEAKAQAIRDQSAAEAGLIQAAAIPVMDGGSVSYDRKADGSVHLATGPAGTVHELAEVAAALDPQLSYGNQYGVYSADPNLIPGLARMSGIPLGAPVAGTQPATASCGTAEQCQAKIEALQGALAKK